MRTKIFMTILTLFILLGVNTTYANIDLNENTNSSLFNELQLKEMNREFTFVWTYLGNWTLELKDKSKIYFKTKYEKFLEIGDKVDLDVYGSIEDFRVLDVWKNNKKLDSDFTNLVNIEKIEKLWFKVLAGKYGYWKIMLDDRIHKWEIVEEYLKLDEITYRWSYLFVLLDKNNKIISITKYN